LPSPPFRDLTAQGEASVFGFQPDEAEALRKVFAYFASYEIKAGIYKGQTGLLLCSRSCPGLWCSSPVARMSDCALSTAL